MSEVGAAERPGAPRLVVVHPDAAAVAATTAARLLVRLVDLQSVRRPVHIGLTGGTVGIATLAAVAESPVRDAVDWTGVHLWWGDERFLPDGDPDRNETQARAALLDVLVASAGLPAGNVHPVPALSDAVPTAEDAAAAYAEDLAGFFPDGRPELDVLLLGMGPDGHVASLFPGHPGLDAVGEDAPHAIAVHDSPKPPPTRVSLTFPVLQSAVQVWIVVAGAEKSDAVARGLGGDDVHGTPAVGAVGTALTAWLIDAAAAAARG